VQQAQDDKQNPDLLLALLFMVYDLTINKATMSCHEKAELMNIIL